MFENDLQKIDSEVNGLHDKYKDNLIPFLFFKMKKDNMDIDNGDLDLNSKREKKKKAYLHNVTLIKRACELYDNEIAYYKGNINDLMAINLDGETYSYNELALNNLDLLAKIIETNRFDPKINLLHLIFLKSRPIGFGKNDAENILPFLDALINSRVDFEQQDLNKNTPIKYTLRDRGINSRIFISLRKYNLFSLNKDNNLFFKNANFSKLAPIDFKNICVLFLLNNLSTHSVEQSKAIFDFFKDKEHRKMFRGSEMQIIAQYKQYLEENNFHITVKPIDLLLFAIASDCRDIIDCFAKGFANKEQEDYFISILDGKELTTEDVRNIVRDGDEFGTKPLEFASRIGIDEKTIKFLEDISKEHSDRELTKIRIDCQLARTISNNNLESFKETVNKYKNFIDFNKFYSMGDNKYTPLMFATLHGDVELTKTIIDIKNVDIGKKDPVAGLSATDYAELSGYFEDSDIDELKTKTVEYENKKRMQKDKEKILNIAKSQKNKKISKEENDLLFSKKLKTVENEFSKEKSREI